MDQFVDFDYMHKSWSKNIYSKEAGGKLIFLSLNLLNGCYNIVQIGEEILHYSAYWLFFLQKIKEARLREG